MTQERTQATPDTAPAREISVSMFFVGFGDCFLVEIPFPGRTCRILFDCGQHRGGGAENQQLADRVIAAARAGGDVARIDLVIGTHRHKDHVSGFAAQGWDKVEVGEVWLPWTENPHDPEARGIAERQVRSAALARLALAPALAAAGTRGKPELQMADELMALALTNEAAMDTLYSGFTGYSGSSGGPPRRYLPDAAAPEAPLGLAGFPGLRFHIMGPSRDAASLAVMNPPRTETFRHLAAASSGADSAARRLTPFAAGCRLDTATLSPEAQEIVAERLSARDKAAIRRFSKTADMVGLAAEIDAAINNTSLVIMVEVGAARLLFCADAQWGNWKSILANPRWCDLIGETSFLKVGHHASHNASPVTLIDKLLPKGIPAMVSVETGAYSNVPYPGLLSEMAVARAINVVRSDLPDEARGVAEASAEVIIMKVPC